jgi:hypothetical protein
VFVFVCCNEADLINGGVLFFEVVFPLFLSLVFAFAPLLSGSDIDLRKQERRSSVDFLLKSILASVFSCCRKLVVLGNFEIDENDAGPGPGISLVTAANVDIDLEKLLPAALVKPEALKLLY